MQAWCFPGAVAAARGRPSGGHSSCHLILVQVIGIYKCSVVGGGLWTCGALAHGASVVLKRASAAGDHRARCKSSFG
ncbi:hypothetical protein EVAR_70824_1 [Eumeta japonica]|uniref:Uncharacterized protein n=1 Tax=Eumeta variegata TaxID=151549 RepID=A0A4C2AFX4_EUMVA|nr:hypothetical protein EVAR_70824_1 [Eumeta japonica]